MSAEPILDLSVDARKVKINNKVYVLREPTEGAVHVWITRQQKDVPLDEKGNLKKDHLRFEKINEAHIDLVGKCLFDEDEHAKGDAGAPVGEKFVRGLGARAHAALLKLVREMGDLDKAESEEALLDRIKRDQEALAKLRDEKGSKEKN